MCSHDMAFGGLKVSLRCGELEGLAAGRLGEGGTWMALVVRRREGSEGIHGSRGKWREDSDVGSLGDGCKTPTKTSGSFRSDMVAA